MVDYTESPLERIISVHRKKKEPPPNGGNGVEPQCNTYGYGSIMGEAAGIITGIPYGAYLLPPFTDPLPNPYQHFPAATHGLHAQDIWLLPNGVLAFTTQQLVQLTIEHPELGGSSTFAYGMVAGYQFNGFQINMQWGSSSSDPAASVGLGITYPPAGAQVGSPVAAPAEPVIALGAPTAGSGSYLYDPASSGGAAVLWWMLKPHGGGWAAYNQFMSRELNGEGDWYTWQISAVCGPLLPHA
jgi:hypothetical protein